MISDEAARQVDDVASAVYGDTSPEVVAFWRAWEAWGIWANGGFEAVFTGGLADDLAAVMDAFEEVGAPAMAELFRSASAALPADVVGTFEARTAFFEHDDEGACAALEAWKRLDQRMAKLPPVNEHLWRVLKRSAQLRARVP